MLRTAPEPQLTPTVASRQHGEIGSFASRPIRPFSERSCHRATTNGEGAISARAAGASREELHRRAYAGKFSAGRTHRRPCAARSGRSRTTAEHVLGAIGAQ
jgi:hypothetical protein